MKWKLVFEEDGVRKYLLEERRFALYVRKRTFQLVYLGDAEWVLLSRTNGREVWGYRSRPSVVVAEGPLDRLGDALEKHGLPSLEVGP